MLSREQINEYVATVCQQIRWKSAHPRITEEITAHLEDSRDSYLAKGLDEKTATAKAIAETGDAAAIGLRLDRVHRPKPQWGMFAATAVLLLLGLLARPLIFGNDENSGSLLARMGWTLFGLAGMMAAYFADFTIIGKYPWAVYFGIMLLSLGLSFVEPPYIGGRPFYAQYSVLLFPLALAAVIFTARNKGYWGIVRCELAFLPLCLIGLSRITRGPLLHFFMVGTVLLGIAVYQKWFGTKRISGFLLMFAPIALLAVIYLVNMDSYDWNRLASMINPTADPSGYGYLPLAVRYLLADAPLFGQGHISERLNWIPSYDTDLLLTVLISLWGWVVFAVISGALLFFIMKGFRRCFRQKSGLGLLVSTAIMLTFSIQAVSYIVFNLGFQFAVPLSLPLISRGNTAMVVNLGLVGLMLSVFRTGDVVADGKLRLAVQPGKFISWTDGKLTINFKTL